MLYRLYVNNENKWPGSLMTMFEPGAMAMFNYTKVPGVEMQFTSEDVKLNQLKGNEKQYTITFIMPEKDVYVTATEVMNGPNIENQTCAKNAMGQNAGTSAKKFCPECGTKLVEGKPFCPECGYKAN